MELPFIFWADILHSLSLLLCCYVKYSPLFVVGRYMWELDLARSLQLEQGSLTSAK